MEPSIDILVYERSEPNLPPALVKVLQLRGKTELGRQETNAETLYTCAWRDDKQYWRIVVARGTEQTIGRHHAFIEPLADGELQITNTSTKSTVHVENGPAISRGSPCVVTVPAGGLLLRLGSSRIVRLQRRGQEEDDDLNALPAMTLRPEEFNLDISTSTLFPQRSLTSSVPEIKDDAVVAWLQTVLSLLQNAANSPDFLPRAARAVVDLAGMDSGRVLLSDRGSWQETARAVREGQSIPEGSWQPSHRVMERVTREKKTFWEMPRLIAGGSMHGIQAVVAAPILDPRGELVGVLYGDRRAVDARPISRVQAMLVELLACGIASRLARQKEEQAALRFEQFFTPQLARILVAQPDLLTGRNAEVTILFCDLRDFSRHSRELGADAVGWVSDVMGAMSDCIIEHHGVLVDYIGDEVMAMWGAPEEQPDHAQLACRAAEAMLTRLPELNARWGERLGEPIRLGIGMNTGPAHVGNVGTQRKFKYGPLGNTVNLASRIQGVTRHLRTRLLLTRDTFAKLDPEQQSRARRACTARVVGIDQPVELFELAGVDNPAGADWKEKYETALAEFEAGHYRLAARTLQPLIVEAINDGPSIVLLSRAVQGLAHGPTPGHPVWELPTK